MRLRQRQPIFGYAGRGAVLQGAMLGVDQMRHQQQVIGHRAIRRQLPQARRAR